MSDEPTVQSLLAANERFYRVFETLDFPAMEALWEKSDRIFCVHPGWAVLRGEHPVLDSLRRIIENTASMHFDLLQVEARLEGNLGIVTLYEHISSQVGHERHTSGVVSTNIFAFDTATSDWKLFHHQASHTAVPDDPELGPLN